jgi:HK97 family phage major capsid protein
MNHPDMSTMRQFAESGRVEPVRRAHRDIIRAGEYVLQAAKAECRELHEHEHRQFQQVMSIASELQQLVQRAQDRESQLASAHARFGNHSDTADIQSVFRGDIRKLDLDLWREFDQPRIERRDLLTTTGAMIPTTVVQDIYQRIILRSGVLAAGPRIINTDPSGASLKLNTFSAFSTAAITAEGSAIAESDPTVTSITLGAYNYKFLTQFSNELVDDNVVNFQQAFAQQASNGIANAIAAHYATGNGTAEPEGIMTNATTGATGGTGVSGAPSVANIVTLFGSLPAQYLPTSSFAMHPATLTYLAGQNDTTGRSLLMPSLADGSNMMLMGRPVLLDSNIASYATGAKSIWFGSMQDYYVVRNAGPLRLTPSMDFALDRDLMTVRVTFRTDAKVQNTDAARVFVGGAS